MLRKVDIEGPGAVKFMNGLEARDPVLALPPTGASPTARCTDEDGKMIDDCTVQIRSPGPRPVLRSQRPRLRALRRDTPRERTSRSRR